MDCNDFGRPMISTLRARREPRVEAGPRETAGGSAVSKATVKGPPREVKELALMGAAALSGKEPSSSSLRNTKRSIMIHDGRLPVVDDDMAATRRGPLLA